MSSNDPKEFLERMRVLIQNGKRYLVPRTRNGVTYIQMIFALGLTNVEEVWNCILELNESHYFSGPDFDRDDPECGKVVWVFKKDINDITTYIKLKDETTKCGCVCISFHEDEV